MDNLSEDDQFISTKRIETLVDGIFAIAMTLMVLNLRLPEPVGVWTNAAVWDALGNQGTNIFIYALSFFILTAFWLNHHRGFDRIQRADKGLFRLNVVWLFFVAIMPFSSYLVGDFGSKTPAALFFNTNLFLLGIFSFLIRRQVIEKELSEKIFEKEDKKLIYSLNLVIPCIAALGMILSFWIPGYSYLIYLLVPIMPIFIRRILGRH
ncbi:MAG: TMEM175 family protein [Methanobacterium sp.]|nr:TMEM175 family protein [Methanobacterium sp.]